MPQIGFWELFVVLGIVLIVFGPRNLPKIGQALGRSIREFRDATKGITQEDDDGDRKPSVPDRAEPTSPPPTESKPSEEIKGR